MSFAKRDKVARSSQSYMYFGHLTAIAQLLEHPGKLLLELQLALLSLSSRSMFLHLELP